MTIANFPTLSKFRLRISDIRFVYTFAQRDKPGETRRNRCGHSRHSASAIPAAPAMIRLAAHTRSRLSQARRRKRRPR